jgi:predicted nucleic acid-binding protein
MARTAIDTSIVVAALLSWHEAHEPAFAALSAALEDGELVLPVSALVECYAVLTRLPAPHRLSPKDAARLLEGSLHASSRTVGLRAGAIWTFVRALVDEDVRGGATYDRRILEEALAAGAQRLLTLNGADFRRFAREGIEVLGPEG